MYQGSETGRVKNTEESEDEDFLKVLQNEAKKEKQNLKRAPRKSIQEELLEIQKAQLKSIEDSNKRQQGLIEKIIEEQRKEDAKEKEKDREFFMNIANLFSKQLLLHCVQFCSKKFQEIQLLFQFYLEIFFYIIPQCSF